MWATNSALTLGMHHSCFCHGLREFFSGAAAPSRGIGRAPTPTPPPGPPKGAGSSGHAPPALGCRPARPGEPHPGRPTFGTGGLGCAPIEPLPNPSSTNRRLIRYTVPFATSRASATWGAGQPSPVLSGIRARVVIRAGLFPPRTRRWRFSRSSGVSRTAYFSLTITATPINTVCPPA